MWPRRGHGWRLQHEISRLNCSAVKAGRDDEGRGAKFSPTLHRHDGDCRSCIDVNLLIAVYTLCTRSTLSSKFSDCGQPQPHSYREVSRFSGAQATHGRLRQANCDLGNKRGNMVWRCMHLRRVPGIVGQPLSRKLVLPAEHFSQPRELEVVHHRQQLWHHCKTWFPHVAACAS